MRRHATAQKKFRVSTAHWRFCNSADAMSGNDAAFFGRPIKRRRIVETPHPDLLRQTQL
jgi:hypothetical protein